MAATMTAECKDHILLMSERVVEPLFQLLVHKVVIEKFDLLRDLAKRKALPDCPEDSEEFFEHGTVLFLGSFGQAASLELQLWLCPNGDREDWEALTVTISNEGTEDLPDITKLTLLDPRDEMKEISSCETVGICRAKRGYVRFYFNWTPHNIISVGSRLVLKVEMRFLRRLVHFGDEQQKQSSTSLQYDVFKYLSKKLFRRNDDEVTVQVGDKKFTCSKALLSSRSPVFEKMLSGKFKEATTNFINLRDIDLDVAKFLLEWTQEDRLPEPSEIDWTKCITLLVAADQFQAQGLAEFCIRRLRQLLTKGNVSFDEIVVVRKMLHECSGLHMVQLARDCDGYVAVKAASDPATMWSIVDMGAKVLPTREKQA